MPLLDLAFESKEKGMGMARYSGKMRLARANKQLDGARAARRSVSFDTNAIDLAPGTVFSTGFSIEDGGPV